MMNRIVSRVAEFLKGEEGPTAVEYAVMLALIIVVSIAAIQILGQAVSSTFNTVGQTINQASSS